MKKSQILGLSRVKNQLGTFASSLNKYKKANYIDLYQINLQLIKLYLKSGPSSLTLRKASLLEGC